VLRRPARPGQARAWPADKRLHLVNGEAAAGDAADRPLDDPWDGIVEIRRELGFRPVHPTVYAARAAGAL
jgi:hypothetical protein